MSADATTLLTALLSAKPPVARASPNPALQQLLLSRMGTLLQQAQGQLQQGRGLNMMVDVDMMREFVRNASVLANHLMAIQQSHIECKQVNELFAEQADADQMCNILVTGDRQRKCKVVSNKCLPVTEAAAGQVAEVQELLTELSRIKHTKANRYNQLALAVLEDLEAKNTAACTARCTAMISQFARAVNNENALFQQQNVKPADQMVEQITAQLAANEVSSLDATVKLLKSAVKQYNAAADEALKRLESQQKVFAKEYAKLGIA